MDAEKVPQKFEKVSIVLNSSGAFRLARSIFRLCLILPLFVLVDSEASIKIDRDYNYPKKEFLVYWNVPTFVCRKYGYDFKMYHEKYGIISNEKDDFRGKSINILYDPGMFPAVLMTPSAKMMDRNGGIPQLGNITVHLENFKRVVEEVVSKDLTGHGILDFEIWRPNFRQNWRDQVIYKNMSLELERQHHPQWPEKKVTENAKVHFEKAAKVFMQKTLELAKLLRPKATWGYYGFPYCYNYRDKTNSPFCPEIVVRENDQIEWLFDSSTALHPSLYMSHKLSEIQQVKFIIGRLNEAWRVITHLRKRNLPKVYPYLWYKYHDKDTFLSEANMYTSFEIPRRYQMGGVIIWGASKDVNTKDKCKSVLNYLDTVLGPVLLKVRKNENNVDQTSNFWPWLSISRPKSPGEEGMDDELEQASEGHSNPSEVGNSHQHGEQSDSSIYSKRSISVAVPPR